MKQKHLKRCLCLLLSLILFAELCPLEPALAGHVQPITPAEKAAALALTGLNEGAAAYHEGMALSASMNAAQLSGWLGEMLDYEMNTLDNTHADIEQALSRLESGDAAGYRQLAASSDGQRYLLRVRQLHTDAEALRQELRHTQDALDSLSSRIKYLLDSLDEQNLTHTQKLRYAQIIRDSTAELRQIRETMTRSAPTWEEQIDIWDSILNGRSQSNDLTDQGLGDWAARVLRRGAQPTRVSSVRASSFTQNDGRLSILSRLSPIQSALADEPDDINIVVLDDSVFIITVRDGQTPVEGLTITLRDQNKEEKKRVDVTAVTDDSGNATFDCKQFIQDDSGVMTVSLHAVSSAHRELFVSELDIPRGSQYILNLNSDIQHPYIQAMDFNGHDILLSEWTALYSPDNDLNHTFRVTVHHSAPLTLTMQYSNGDENYESITANVSRPAGGSNTSVVTFTEKWKAVLAPGSKVRFLLSEDSGYQEMYQTKLKMADTPFERPFIDKGNKLLGSLTKGLGVGVTIPKSAGKPWAGSRISLENIPILEEYMPHVQIDLDGSVFISIGQKAAENDPDKWKTQDQKDLDKKIADQEKDSFWKANKAGGGMLEQMDSHPKNFFGAAKANLTFFAALFARWPRDEDRNVDIHAGGYIGAAITFGMEFTYTNPPFFVSGGITASLAVSFQLGIEINTDKNLNVKRFRFDFGSSGFTILLRITVSLSAGLGIKGVVSFSVVGSASFSIVLLLTGNPSTSISLDLGVSLAAEVLWIKYNITVWSYHKQIYPKEETLSGAAGRFTVKNSAQEEESGLMGSTPLAAEAFPDLKADVSLQQRLGTLSAGVRYANVNGVPFLFFIRQDNGSASVAWVNLTDGKTGDFLSFLAQEGMSGSLIDYAFDVRVPEEGGNRVQLAMLRTDRMVREGTTTLEDGTVIVHDGPVQSSACILTLSESGGALQPVADDDLFESFHLFDVQEAFGFTADEISFSDTRLLIDRAETTVQVQQHLRYDQDELQNARHTGVLHMSRGGENDVYLNYYKPSDRPSPAAGASRTAQRATIAFNSQGEETDWRIRKLYAPIYSLEVNGRGTDSRLMTVDMADVGRVPLHEGNILFYDLYSQEEVSTERTYYGYRKSGTVTDYLFCLEHEETGEETSRTVLKGLRNQTTFRWVEPLGTQAFLAKENHILMSDFDITVPASRFDLQKIYGSIYLYWLETGAKESDTGPDITRLSGVIFDPVTNVCMGKYVLAEIPSSSIAGDPGQIFLGADGNGYFTSRSGSGYAVYSFPLHIVPSLAISTGVLDNNVVRPGAYLDFNIGLTNTGSAPIAAFEIEALSGSEVFETLHVDCLNPENNRLTMQDGTSAELSGEHTVYPLRLSQEPMVQREWLINRKSFDAFSGGVYNVQEYSDKISTDMLLPGSFVPYQATLKLPGSWKAGGRTISLRFKSLSVQRDFVRAAALLSGVSAQEDAALPGLITYSMSGDGQTLSRSTLPNDDTEGLSLYVSRAPSSAPFALTHDVHELEVFHRVYHDPQGNERISITLMNQAEMGDSLKLYAEVFPDGESTPYYVNLPYYSDSTSHGRTHTIDLPMSALLQGRSPHTLLVAVRAAGVQETASRDNEFVLYFDKADEPLRFVQQPLNQAVLPGETVTFTAQADGGRTPYTWVWQVSRDKGLSWQDIPGADSDLLTLSDVTRDMDGNLYRVRVTDAKGQTIASTAAALHVGRQPVTGDNSHAALYLILAALALGGYLILRRRRVQEQQK